MTTSELSDDDLLRQARVRPEVFATLYERHAPSVHAYLRRRVGAVPAEDLLGEVFAAALTARMRVIPHESGSALPWLYGIAGNLVRGHLRRPAQAPALTAGRSVLDKAIDCTRRELTTRRRRRSAALASIGLAAAAAVVVGPTLAVPGRRPSANAAAAVLNAAAESAGAQTGGWPHAKYWHAVSTYVRDGRTFHREIWLGHDKHAILIDPGVDAGVISVGGDPRFTPGLTWAQLYALPANPMALAEVLRHDEQGQGQSPDQQLFSTCASLLGESPASPSLRRALFQVAATVPGVRADGTVTDRAGREGQGVSGYGEQIVVDTETGQLLQEREGSGWVGTYLSQGPTSTAPALPGA